MELTRRDALAALAAAGISTGVGAAVLRLDAHDGKLTQHEVRTLSALAEVVYPSTVEDVPAFVERYAVGRTGARPEYREGVRRALGTLDDYAETFHGSPFVDLAAGTRRELLSKMSVDVADPDPGGTDHERVRHYLVNDLLYAFYSSPTGGRLVGIENPPGYPGGQTSYRRGPPDG